MTAKDKYYKFIQNKLISNTDFKIMESIDGLYVEIAFPMDIHYTTYDIDDLVTISFDVEDEADHNYLKSNYGVKTEEETNKLLKEYWSQITKNILWEMKQSHPNDPQLKCLA